MKLGIPYILYIYVSARCKKKIFNPKFPSYNLFPASQDEKLYFCKHL